MGKGSGSIKGYSMVKLLEEWLSMGRTITTINYLLDQLSLSGKIPEDKREGMVNTVNYIDDVNRWT